MFAKFIHYFQHSHVNTNSCQSWGIYTHPLPERKKMGAKGIFVQAAMFLWPSEFKEGESRGIKKVRSFSTVPNTFPSRETTKEHPWSWSLETVNINRGTSWLSALGLYALGKWKQAPSFVRLPAPHLWRDESSAVSLCLWKGKNYPAQRLVIICHLYAHSS